MKAIVQTMLTADEPVDVVKVQTYDLLTEPRYFFYGWKSSPVICGRRSAVERLCAAQKELPGGYHFKIWDGQRSPETQRQMHESFLRRVRWEHPEWPLE